MTVGSWPEPKIKTWMLSQLSNQVPQDYFFYMALGCFECRRVPCPSWQLCTKQHPRDSLNIALGSLRAGRLQCHWMWAHLPEDLREPCPLTPSLDLRAVFGWHRNQSNYKPSQMGSEHGWESLAGVGKTDCWAYLQNLTFGKTWSVAWDFAFQTSSWSWCSENYHLKTVNLHQEQQTSSIKGQTVNIVGLAGHTVSVATTHLYHWLLSTFSGFLCFFVCLCFFLFVCFVF